ncbi:MAG: ATP-binding protein [Candidatus Aenigmatarchaeota archaeon]
MIKEVLLRQKIEVEEIVKGKFIERENIEKIIPYLNTKLIKVIIGLRRSGKSFLGIHLIKKFNFGYVNFDDERLVEVKDYDEILKNLHEIYGKVNFLFFDEIQNLEKWELFVNRLQRSGYNIIITGSNAKLLSKELATHLTGRYIEIENFPFSFREFLKAKDFKIRKEELEIKELRGKLLNLLNEYLKIGGLPEVVIEKYRPENYVRMLFDSIIFKDIVKRYNLRFSSKIYELARYLISNISTLQSFNKINEILNFRSVHTVQNYFEYLKEAYLIFHLDAFSFSIKNQIKSKKKVYSMDLSFPNFTSFKFSENIGRLIENLVAIELLRKGYKEVYYWKDYQQNEVDFVIKQGLNIKQLIQVTYVSSKDEIDKREIKALIKASELLKCKNLQIITWDYEDELKVNEKTIKCIPLWKWLLER